MNGEAGRRSCREGLASSLRGHYRHLFGCVRYAETMWFSHTRVGMPKQRSIKQLRARLTQGFRDSRKGLWLPNPEAVMVALGGFQLFPALHVQAVDEVRRRHALAPARKWFRRDSILRGTGHRSGLATDSASRPASAAKRRRVWLDQPGMSSLTLPCSSTTKDTGTMSSSVA